MVRAWQSTEPISDLTLHADWDSISSMILSLRIHLFEYGTIPVWNFMFCGGRPELAVPYSWAWTWPSLFAYLFEPNHAILAAWIALSCVGFFAARLLLVDWSGSALGATVGAAIYAFSGLYASRFNAGHVTFAFFHLVPVLMLAFERAFAGAIEGSPKLGATSLAVLASFAFTSAALPHGLVYFYPAFALLVVVRVVGAWRRLGASVALRAAALLVAANALGAWLAAYKLWPIISWQLDAPRAGVAFEAYDVAQVIGNTLTFVSGYLHRVRLETWHVYPSWEYNAYVGPLPWMMALLVFVVATARWLRRRGHAAASDDGNRRTLDPTVWYGLALVVLGIWLSLGNAREMAPGSLFGGLQVLDGIRAFNRFQILIVFGLAILTAHGFAATALLAENRARSLLIVALAVGGVAPVALQAAYLAWNIRAEPNASILARYGEPNVGTPKLVRSFYRHSWAVSHQTSLLGSGYWIANCRSDIALPGRPPRIGWSRVAALTRPIPGSLVNVSPASITLDYAADERAPVILNLRVPKEFSASTPTEFQRRRIMFDTSTLAGQPFTFTASHAAAKQGAVASAAGALATAAFLVALARRGPSH
jgi:hypothetical protein